jgi:hypothetical protein
MFELTNDGNIFCFDCGYPNVIFGPNPIKNITKMAVGNIYDDLYRSSSNFHFILLDKEGFAYAKGNNDLSQIYHKSSNNIEFELLFNNVIDIACGRQFSNILTIDGLYTIGIVTCSRSKQIYRYTDYTLIENTKGAIGVQSMNTITILHKDNQLFFNGTTHRSLMYLVSNTNDYEKIMLENVLSFILNYSLIVLTKQGLFMIISRTNIVKIGTYRTTLTFKTYYIRSGFTKKSHLICYSYYDDNLKKIYCIKHIYGTRIKELFRRCIK